ncbi:putative monogalactosyldiacylglycerol synthase 3, chloroplastic [Cocos nucifera]|uniref:Putative monogalactosyldiacylglycerol synthase 3, chloroplastic n=1 Tax=Cocos nucifera TaxID=13894 RepID=A0A8K0ITR7_COCNU|nr:putative monogalactosyldiacylglycerol synthase 3, chloroplastic [Cocos nucifera]
MGPVKKTAKALGESLFDKEHDKPSCYSCSADSLSIFFALSGGTSTIAEALIRGLPIILNDFIPGQEVGNVPHVVDNGTGVFSKSSKQTACLVARWFGPESEGSKMMSQNALKLAQPDAVFDIVKDINELAQQLGPLSRISYSLTSSFYQPM